MRARAQSFVALVVLLACCTHASALDPSLDISQYAHTTWKIRDGFAKGSINSIAQTLDGYLWFGTDFGLFRFDGVRAVPWQPTENQHILPWNFSLLVSKDGTLWIGGKGLGSWNNHKLTDYPELSDQYVFKILEDREAGTVWVGSTGVGVSTGKLCAIHQGVARCESTSGGVYSLFEDSKGTLWAGTQAGLWRWRPGPPKLYPMPDLNGLQALAEDSDGALLVGWKGTIYRFANEKVQHSVGETSHPFKSHKMLRDTNGGLWIGTLGMGLLHVHQGRTDVFTAANGLSGDTVQAIFEDREHNIWVSTENGLDRFRELAAPTLTSKQGLSENVGSVLAGGDGSVWFATLGGLSRWDRGQITIPLTGSGRRDGKLNGSYPDSLFQDERGRIWLGTAAGFGYLENSRFSPIKDVPGGTFLSIAQDPAGNVWAINENAGLFRISSRDDVLKIPWSVFGHKDHASVLAVDPKQGGLWIGFFLGGIVYFSDGQVRASYTATDGLGTGRISDFLFDDEGTLWISTEGGFSRLKNSRLATISSKKGLPCDTVHWATTDNNHQWWLYMTCGLIRIDRSELDAWAAAADKGENTPVPLRVTVLDDSDGVRSLPSSSHWHPQVAKTPDGRLWFLPWDGVSVIDPHNLHENKLPPPVHIEKITADDKAVDISNGMHLPTAVRHLDIDYTALSLVVPEKVHFRVKLEGEDKDWRELVNVRHVEYTNLPPKHYRFRVQACNNSGVWNEEGAALDFVIPPAWYQTNWFRGACIAAFLMMIWGIHALRVRQLAAQFNMRLEERVAERTRIARDLHDTLLQSFQGLLLEFQAVAYRLQPGEIKNAQEDAIRGASQAITEGRDTVQGLRTSIVQERDLAKAIRAFGEELASSAINQSPVAFEVVVEGRRKRKRPFLRDEIYRIAIEALRNAFRHAQADRIEVELQYGDKAFTLRIRDNGRGIDRDVLSGAGCKGHFGLHGMRERAKLAGGELEIWSEVDSGTEIELTIPASRAYLKPPRRSWFRNLSQKDSDSKEKSAL